MKKSFEQYDRENPAIYQAFVRYARQLRCTGRKRIGAKLIMERIRWDSAVGASADLFKINNNFTAGYVRKLIAEEPDFRELFEIREKGGRISEAVAA